MDLQIDVNQLYREELYTDLQIATLRKLVPVKSDGTLDPDRPVIWTGETQVMTSVGTIPVSARLKGNTLSEAIQDFPTAIEAAINELMEQAREMQRRESSGLILPRGAMPPGASERLRGGGIELP